MAPISFGSWRGASAQGVEKSAWFQRFEAPVRQATHASTHAIGSDTHVPRWTLVDEVSGGTDGPRPVPAVARSEWGDGPHRCLLLRHEGAKQG